MFGVDFNIREGGEVDFLWLDRKSAPIRLTLRYECPIIARSR